MKKKLSDKYHKFCQSNVNQFCPTKMHVCVASNVENKCVLPFSFQDHEQQAQPPSKIGYTWWMNVEEKQAHLGDVGRFINFEGGGLSKSFLEKTQLLPDYS